MNTTRLPKFPIAISAALLAGMVAPPAFGQAVSANASCTTCPARVPDGGAAAVTPQLLVAPAVLAAGSCGGLAPMGGIEVRMDLLHNHIGDLSLQLIGPDNTTYSLLNRLADGALTCSGEDIRGSFVAGVDGAATPTCRVRIPVVGELAAPAADMATLAAAPIAGGAWTLQIGDHADAGEGLLRSWQFNVYCEQFGVLFRDGFDD